VPIPVSPASIFAPIASSSGETLADPVFTFSFMRHSGLGWATTIPWPLTRKPLPRPRTFCSMTNFERALMLTSPPMTPRSFPWASRTGIAAVMTSCFVFVSS